MKLTFICLLVIGIQFSLWTQTPIYSSDIIPVIGDEWFVAFSSGGDQAFDVDLGDSGPNSVFDFSAYGNTSDIIAGELIMDINENNALGHVKIVGGEDLVNVPEVFESVDFYLNYLETAGANWYMPFRIEDEGLQIMGEMATMGSSTPQEWIYYHGVHFGPGRNIPFNISLGDTVHMERFEIDVRPNGTDSIHIQDVYVFDAEGEYISPHQESFSDVCRLIHLSNIEIYTAVNGAWSLSDQITHDFVEYRKRGYLLPLAEIGAGYYEPVASQIVSSWDISADFYFPTFVLSSLGKKEVSLEALVSPNPAHEFISIQFYEETKMTSIFWMDNLGRELEYIDYNNLATNHLTVNTPNQKGI